VKPRPLLEVPVTRSQCVSLFSRPLRALVLALVPVLASCAQGVTYQFPSCDPTKQEIYSLRVSRAYRPSPPEDRLVNRTLPTNDPRRVPFFRAYLYSTYPDFAPIETASEDQRKRSASALGSTEIPTLWLIHGNGISFFLESTSELQDAAPWKRKREESPDGKYWVYANPAFRQGRPSNDATVYFLPKETGRRVLIRCPDDRSNTFPSDANAHCTVESLLNDSPALACVTIGFRVPAADASRWQELTRQVSEKFRSMLSISK